MAAKLCNICNKRRPYTGSKGTETAAHGSEMCNYCYEEGGWENTHQDEEHADGALGDGCWICHPELNLAQTSHMASTGPKKQGARRPQLNHKGHSHPQTPAARRECKKAFWAVIAQSGAKTEETIAQFMANWDARLDGHGKAITTTPEPPAVWKVAPRTRTRSVQSTGK